MAKEQLIWLYEFIIKQTKEKHLFMEGWVAVLEWEIEFEIDQLLLKYNCEPIIN